VGLSMPRACPRSSVIPNALTSAVCSSFSAKADGSNDSFEGYRSPAGDCRQAKAPRPKSSLSELIRPLDSSIDQIARCENLSTGRPAIFGKGATMIASRSKTPERDIRFRSGPQLRALNCRLTPDRTR
jgi:hypothetical protein